MRLLLGSLVAACSGPQVAREPACAADARVVLRGQDDVLAAARCLAIVTARTPSRSAAIASLEIRTGAALDLAPLNKLHVILGELRVGPTVGFVQLDLPELSAAGAITIAGNGDLHGIALPMLTSVGAIAIEQNVALTTLALPRLATAASVLVRGHAELGLVELSSLVTVEGELRVADNPQLTLLELAKLERAGAVAIENNGALDPSIVDAARSKIAP